MSDPCLSPAQLWSLLEDQLAEPERSIAERHLSDCPDCQSSAEQLIQRIGVPLEAAREPAPPTTDDEQHRIGTLVRQVKRLLQGPPQGEQFIPGTILAGRYRIGDLLGKGSMGEVYRAHDLQLNLPIALKLLPEHLSANPTLRASIINEARLSRKITDRHVCRVHDVVETDEHLFLTMEYIAGGNLAILLRTIGRVHDKRAQQIAWELCLGLSAAHQQGVIHRDLKPANVMIDQFGRVRINDFGLAQTTTVGFQPARGFVGTVAYAAPEQVLEGPTTVQSDLFSLGLILYELFLGRRACTLSMLTEVRDWHRSGTPIEFPKDFHSLDPKVSRIIERCLSHHPGDRPLSADEVAMAFVGAEPVRLAVESGTAPTPDDLAEAGVRRPLTPRQMGWCAGILTVLLAIIGLLAPWTLPAHLDADHSPSVLSNQARDVLRELGYVPGNAQPSPSPRADSGYGFTVHRDVSGPVYFWYRHSPQPLVPRYFISDLNRPMYPSRGMVNWDDPPLDVPGMVLVWLDSRGALRGLRAVPKPVPGEPPASFDPDRWQGILSRLTHLDLSQHRPRRRISAAPVPADTAIEWLPPAGSVAHLETSFLHDRLVYLRVGEETQSLGAALEWNEPLLNRRLGVIGVLLPLALVVWGGWACWTQAITRRLDYASVVRLTVVTYGVSMAAWLLRAKHVPALEEAAVLQAGLAHSVLRTSLVCLWYAAIEYSLRKHAHDTMIGWTKLLRGEILSPHVGRDVLAGVIG
ncbi:MAG TPA: protein kinase, partial [Planctomycetaceae bacterium]|nr:protein kinase [Planctomycetaceae bacterium]